MCVVNNSSPSVTASLSTDVPVPSSQDAAAASLSRADEVPANVVVTPTAQSMENIGRIPLPYVLPMHSMRESLKTALRNGDVLTSGQRPELLEAIYLDVTQYTL